MMLSTNYYAVIRQSKKPPYQFLVMLPQQGITTEGKTMVDAIKNAQSEMNKWLSDSITANHKLPVPITNPLYFELEDYESAILIESHLSI